MIKNNEPLSMAEVLDFMKKTENAETDVIAFIKKLTKLTSKEAKELREKLEELQLIKMRPEYLVKIIDLLPENSEDLNKIFTDVGLNEDETKKILDAVKQFK